MSGGRPSKQLALSVRERELGKSLLAGPHVLDVDPEPAFEAGECDGAALRVRKRNDGDARAHPSPTPHRRGGIPARPGGSRRRPEAARRRSGASRGAEPPPLRPCALRATRARAAPEGGAHGTGHAPTGSRTRCAHTCFQKVPVGEDGRQAAALERPVRREASRSAAATRPRSGRDPRRGSGDGTATGRRNACPPSPSVASTGDRRRRSRRCPSGRAGRR